MYNKVIKYLSFLIFLGLTKIAFGNSSFSNYDLMLYQSFKSGDMNVWVRVMDEMKYDVSRNESFSKLFSLTQAQYGYIGYLIGAKQNRLARQYIREAEQNIDRLMQMQPQNSDVLAIKASLLAYHIALSPYKAPFLGPRSMNMIDDALALNRSSAQALIEKGNAAHYAPSMFGGNPVDAAKHYRMALNQMRTVNGNDSPQSWLYLNTMAQLALAYEKANDIKSAKDTYLSILSLAPDFKWVKEELYPDFLGRN